MDSTGLSTCPACGVLHQAETPARQNTNGARPRPDGVPAPVLLVPEDESDSWAPVDLGPYLRGEIRRAEPTVGIVRGDGLRLLYPGKEHAVIGEMEAGKSWFCLACAAAELLAGHHVLYAHFEECDPSDTVERLLALGVTAECMVALFHFVGPERMVSPEVLGRLLDPVPSLVVFDGVNEGMSLHRWDIRDEDGAASFRRHLVKPCTRVGAATLSADHVVKDPERRGRTALGSIHKGNGLSGALILLENAEPFGRGQRGRSHVFVTKDRPGHLRRHGRPSVVPGKTFVGELVVDDAHPWTSYLDLSFFAPAEHADQPAETSTLADSVVMVLAALPDQTVGSERALFAQVRAAGHEAGESRIRNALDDLLVSGRVVEHPGPRSAKGYRAVLTAAQDQQEFDS